MDRPGEKSKAHGSSPWRAGIKQSFQSITGTLKNGNTVSQINRKLNGDQISFTRR
jgi:hypothetical protein